MKRYLKATNTKQRKALEEKNDCAVIALSITCRITYKTSHAACKGAGRVNKRGLHTRPILMIAQEQGFKTEPVKNLIQKSGAKFTPKTIGQKLKRGYYLCFCNGHVFAVVNGDVEDWTNNRKHHIYEAYKITRI